MPYLSVKFLAELVCVPPVLAAFYLILKYDARDPKVLNFILCGALLGLAFSIRVHTILFAGALGLIMLFDKQWLKAVAFSIAYLMVAFIFMGLPDWLFFDYPFHSLINYYAHNTEHAYNYISGSPYKFLLTTIGFLVPPISLFILWGYLRRGWKINMQIFLAVAVFFIFHSSFPNQQERFILPMFPLLIILGMIGWNQWKETSSFWRNNVKLYKGLWLFFWILNIVAATALAFTYTKKDRVAPLHYLSKKDDVKSVIIEGRSVKQPPAYYLGGNSVDYSQFPTLLGMTAVQKSGRHLEDDFKFIFVLDKNKSKEQLIEEMASVQKEPNYIIMKGSDELEQRIENLGELFPGKEFVLEKVISPSYFDQLLHILNPRIHKDTAAFIYKIK